MTARINQIGKSMVCFTVASVALVGCSKPEQEARKRFEFLKANHASLGEICDAGREMVRAYSIASDTVGYGSADIESRSACLDADLTGREQSYGRPIIEPDSLDAMPDTTTAAKLPADDAEIGRMGWNGE